jgi:hypothetical protein
MFKTALPRWLAVLLLTPSFLALAGCGSGGAGSVSGKVTFQGKPLPSGRITFFCEGGEKPVMSCNIKDGAYKIDKAAVGSARVSVQTFEFKRVHVPGEPKSSNLPGDEEPATPGSYVRIPQKYRVPDSSGLTYTITKGAQTKDFELTP